MHDCLLGMALRLTDRPIVPPTATRDIQGYFALTRLQHFALITATASGPPIG